MDLHRLIGLKFSFKKSIFTVNLVMTFGVKEFLVTRVSRTDNLLESIGYVKMGVEFKKNLGEF